MREEVKDRYREREREKNNKRANLEEPLVGKDKVERRLGRGKQKIPLLLVPAT